VGNEEGHAAETSWATYDPVGRNNDEPAPGYNDYENSPVGTIHGHRWLPAECDVSIRPGWFWHEAEDSHVKSPDELFDLYCQSVGRGASLLLNVPPSRAGQIDAADVASLSKFGKEMKVTFAHNLAAGAKTIVTNWRGSAGNYSGQKLLSTNRSSYWATDDGVTTAEAELDLGGSKTFDLIRLREPIQLGQRLEAFSVDAWQNGSWTEVGTATSVGNCRIIRLTNPVTTDKVRLRVTKSAAPILLYGFGLYLSAFKRWTPSK
jgi:alpha-L-fucosidase